LNGVDADVNQHVDALSGADRHGVCARRQGDDLAGARCDEDSAGRVDGKTVAQHASREYRIGYLVQYAAPSVERSQDLLG